VAHGTGAAGSAARSTSTAAGPPAAKRSTSTSAGFPAACESAWPAIVSAITTATPSGALNARSTPLAATGLAVGAAACGNAARAAGKTE
jgi:hypothetical protein